MVGHLDGCGHLVALQGVEIVGKPAIEDDAHFTAESPNGIWEHSSNFKCYIF